VAGPTARRHLVAWVGVGVLIQLVVVGIELRGGSGDPAAFVHFGYDTATIALAHRDLGPHVDAPNTEGADGQDFWVLATDPLLIDVAGVKPYLDRPAYRADRIGYPLVVAPWRVFGQEAVLWGLIVTNVVAAAIGTWAAARIATEVGLPERACLAFALCPGVAVATLLDTGDGVALVLILLAIMAVLRQRWGWAVAAGVAAVLTRETSVLALIGIAALGPALPRRWRAALVGIPAAALAAWAIYVRLRLGGHRGGTATDVTWPFLGFYRILFDPGAAATDVRSKELAVLLLLVAVAAVVLWWRQRDSLLLSAALPFALFAPLLGPFVLGRNVNSLRVFAPLVTLFVLGVYPRRVVMS